MHLSWQEIRIRATDFAKEWEGAGEEKRDTQSFYNDFFHVFGVGRRSVGAHFEYAIRTLGGKRGYVDLLWPGTLAVEQKSAGESLETARKQALDYIASLSDPKKPRFLLLSDFDRFVLISLEEGNARHEFTLAQFPDNVERFGFILGLERRIYEDQAPVNIDAAELMGGLHDLLEASGYVGHDLEQFLVRMVFCLFADDTGIFQPKNILLEYVEDRTQEDGSDLGPKLAQLFEVLNTPEANRQRTLGEELKSYPHVNGKLFADRLPAPAFDRAMREKLLEACHFDWAHISPAIFGSLFQSVMNRDERRAKGAHYTTERNIRKVIGPLFLDDLREEFRGIMRLKRNRAAKLRALQEKMAEMAFLDPACGCGNFLVVAYRELRELELDVLRALHKHGQLDLMADTLSKVDVDQFHGIEMEEFPALISETAMWMMDHIMNRQLSAELGQVYTRIPLQKAPNVRCADALEIDWEEVLPSARCKGVLGNPPFIGSKYQSPQQRQQVRRIAALGGSGGTLDYVAAWFIKAGEYIRGESRIGLVATNSITQGEQVAQLWPILFERCGLEIAFGHRTFAWSSDARGKAHVHVTIIGLDRRENARKKKRLFSYSAPDGDPDESLHCALSPYLVDATAQDNPHLVVREASKPINGMPGIVMGTQPIDGGYLIFSQEEYDAFLKAEPGAKALMRPFIGSREFINKIDRYILYAGDSDPGKLRELPKVREIMKRVTAWRRREIPRKGGTAAEVRAAGNSAQHLADQPTEFNNSVVPDKPFLAIPETSSERRAYVPIAMISPPIIPHNSLKVLIDASLTDFALLTSAMHMSWLRLVGGRLESRYRYTIGVVYNTFPLPTVSQDKLAQLDQHAQRVLDARAEHPEASLADLYDPDFMPSSLRKAHQALDKAVDRLYRKSAFKSDRDRSEHLLRLYEKFFSPCLGQPARHGR